MKTVLKALSFALSLSSLAIAKDKDCFHSYRAQVINRSGGIADFSRTSGIGNASRKTEIPNNGSIEIVIQKRGAKIDLVAGPEDSKSKQEIVFYSKDFRTYRPSVILNQKGFTAEGFSQKPITFKVRIDNQSGGNAKIIDACDASGRGSTIREGKSSSITVRPSSYIVVEAGPEKQKVRSKIVFAEQTGDQPTITIVQRGFMSRGIQGKNLEIQTLRIPVVTRVRPEKHSKKMVENMPMPQKRQYKKVGFMNNRHNEQRKKYLNSFSSRTK